MGKKQYQSKSRYGRKPSPGKKKHAQRATNSHEADAPSEEVAAETRTEPVAPPVARAPRTTSRPSSHPYVKSDLIRTLVIAGIAFVILIILYFVL